MAIISQILKSTSKITENRPTTVHNSADRSSFICRHLFCVLKDLFNHLFGHFFCLPGSFYKVKSKRQIGWRPYSLVKYDFSFVKKLFLFYFVKFFLKALAERKLSAKVQKTRALPYKKMPPIQGWKILSIQKSTE